MKEIKQIYFFFSFLILVFLFANAITYAEDMGPPPPSPCSAPNKVCLVSAFGTGGNQTITVCAGTPGPLNASKFNVWYNGSGPLNFSNGGIVSAEFWNGTAYDLTGGPAITNETLNPNGPGCGVNLILNKSFTNRTIQINITTNGSLQYVQNMGPAENATMFTINYVSLQIVKGDGITPLPSAIFMTFNNATKQYDSNGPGGTNNAGYWAEHCVGIVQGLNCIPNNEFVIEGIPPCKNVQGQPGCSQDTINGSKLIYAFDFLSSNVSALGNLTPGTPLILPLGIPSAASFINVAGLKANPMQNGPFDNDVNISAFDVEEYGNPSNVFFSMKSSGFDGFRPPLFLQKGKFYNVKVNVSSGSYAGVYNYPIMLPYVGFTGLMAVLSNSFDRSTVYGKVVNESNVPVEGTLIYAQIYKGGGGDGIMFINSSVTNANGVFSISLPKTQSISTPGQCPGGTCQMQFPVYQFAIVSNRSASNGAPLYFQTVDNNAGMGYFAQQDNIYLPKQIILKSGGQANVNITLNGAGTLISELAKIISLGTGAIKDAVTGKYTMLSIFGDNVEVPASIVVPFFSPTGSVLIDIMGGGSQKMGQSNTQSHICINSTSVTQGGITSLNCNLTTPGFINFTVRTCNNLFAPPQDCNNQQQAGDFGFWFELNGIIRDSSGNVIMYLSPEGMILPELIGFGGSSPNVNIPLPEGNYTIEIAPSFDWSRYLGVRNNTLIEIKSNETVNYVGTLAESWRINPMFNPSMVLSDNNIIETSVDYGSAGQLDNTRVSLNARVLYMNKSAASGFSPLVYNDTTKRFVNSTFKPSALGLNAGKYLLLLNATNISGSSRYTSTAIMPMYAYDFQLGLDMGGFTFGTNRTASGKIFAFNSSGPIAANTSPIIVEMMDQTGAPVSFVSRVSSISNGFGAINITMPDKVGFYDIVVKVNASNKVGISDYWLQVSNFNVQAITDRFNYQSSDTVSLTVKVVNASNNQPQNASVEVSLDGSSTPAAGVTTDGKAVILLDPATYGTNGNWSYGWHNMHVKISILKGSDVMSVDTWAGFDVRGIEMQIRSDKPSYTQSDLVLLNVFAPSDYTVSSLKVDGQGWTETLDCPAVYSEKKFCVPCVGSCETSKLKQINLSSGWGPGHHNVEVKVSTGQGDQTFFTGFDINTYNIFATTNKFSYDTNENITLNITVAYPNGTAVSNKPIVASLYKAQPPNDIYVTNASGNTGADGKIGLRLNATQTGFNIIKINASGQMWFIGVQVSTLKVELQNSTGGAVSNNEYSGVAGGEPVTIRVNATSSGIAVADGSEVRASIWAFGRQEELPSNTTTNGIGIISFTIPADAPAQVYGLEIKVTTPSGDTGLAPPSALRVGGGDALKLSVSADRSFMQPYMPGEAAVFTAVLTRTDGTPVQGRAINFAYGSEGTMPTNAGSATTGTDGIAKLKGITAPTSDGPYYLQASVNGTDVQTYSGFLVSSLNVRVTPNQTTPYTPGEYIGLNITVTNRTTGAVINATGGFVAIFNKEKGKRDESLTDFSSQPYQKSIYVPNEKEAVGSYPIGVVIFSGSSQGNGFALVDVVNSTKQLNVSLPANMTANSTFNISINASEGTTAKVVVFSPSASSLVYENTSVVLSGGGANISVATTYPGTYIVDVFIDGVGSKKQVITVLPPAEGFGNAPQLWTHTSAVSASSTNTTTFTTSNDVYIMSNIANSTATIMRVTSDSDTTVSTSIPLNQNISSTYYAVIDNTELTASTAYFVRLDTEGASGVTNTMFKVA